MDRGTLFKIKKKIVTVKQRDSFMTSLFLPRYKRLLLKIFGVKVPFTVYLTFLDLRRERFRSEFIVDSQTQNKT